MDNENSINNGIPLDLSIDLSNEDKINVRLCQQKISSHQRYGRRCVERAEHAHPLLHLPAARRGVLSARFP